MFKSKRSAIGAIVILTGAASAGAATGTTGVHQSPANYYKVA